MLSRVLSGTTFTFGPQHHCCDITVDVCENTAAVQRDFKAKQAF